MEQDDPGVDRPIRTLTYRLTPQDAYAWVSMPRPYSGTGKFLSILWLMLAGVAMGLLPESIVGADRSLRWWAIGGGLLLFQFAVLVLVFNLRLRRRARRLVPAPCDVELEEWGDHLCENRGGRTTAVPLETIASVTRAGRHVFIDAPDDVIIIPARAFEDTGDMVAFAEGWDEAARDPDAFLYGAKGGENR